MTANVSERKAGISNIGCNYKVSSKTIMSLFMEVRETKRI
jgi:hypothetical protein